MRAFVTGATGFIGGRLAQRLRERADEVVALVRTPAKATTLQEMGCEIVPGDLSSANAIRTAMAGCDAAFHVAADYRVGIRETEVEAMREANVRGTEIVLDAAIDAGVAKIVYVSTIGAFGNTRGEVVDESFERTDLDFLTAYDETKYYAHEVARDRIAKGAPIVIVQPGGVYGPGDTSDLARLIDFVRRGKLPFLPLGDTGFNFVHVDDVVDGILAAHDKAPPGETYVLGGELTTVRDFVHKVAELSGKRRPFDAPTALLRAMVPIGPLIGKLTGTPPNLKEIIRGGDGVTYWATDAKARRELGYSPRDLHTGLEQTLAATAKR